MGFTHRQYKMLFSGEHWEQIDLTICCPAGAWECVVRKSAKPPVDPLQALETPASDPRIQLTRDKIAEAEMRVAHQQRELQRLRALGLPTEEAEKILDTFNMTLLQMRNHHDILSVLLSPPQRRRHPRP